MPLTTRSGKTVSLLRPEAKKPTIKPKNREENHAGTFDLPQVKGFYNFKRKSKYPPPKVSFGPRIPVFVSWTFRHHAVLQDMILSDHVTDILHYYLDFHVPGWDTEVPSLMEETDIVVRQAEEKLACFEKRSVKHNGLTALPRRMRSSYQYEKVKECFNIPRSTYIALRSVALVMEKPIEDVTVEAMMFYFDEFLPGWEFNGDVPDEDPNAGNDP